MLSCTQSSECIVWTACGVEENAMKVGNVLGHDDLVNDRLSVDLTREDCHYSSGPGSCKITKDTPYYFTVLRQSAANPDFKVRSPAALWLCALGPDRRVFADAALVSCVCVCRRYSSGSTPCQAMRR